MVDWRAVEFSLGVAHCPCSEWSLREETAAEEKAEIPAQLHLLLLLLLQHLPLWAGDTSLSLVLPFPSLPPHSASCDLAEGSGLVVVSLKDTELSFYVTLFKCLIKLNLA